MYLLEYKVNSLSKLFQYSSITGTIVPFLFHLIVAFSFIFTELKLVSIKIKYNRKSREGVCERESDRVKLPSLW